MAGGRVFEAVEVAGPPPEDDIEVAFDSWRSGLKDSETPGYVRAYRVPLDEQGKASYSATGQVRLGTWAIDQYDFDTLCTKIMRDYMLPTENMMAVRLIGTITGKGGLSFNKIVTLQRPNATAMALPNPNAPNDQIAAVMKSMADSNERMMRMFQEMGAPKPQGESQGEMMRTVAMMRVMMEPMMGMMGPMLAALAGRPPPPAGPSSSMKETIETMMLVDRFMGRRGGGGGESSAAPDWLQAVTAVSGVAKPLLEMAAARQTTEPRTRQNAIAAPAPVQPVAQPVQPQAVPPVHSTPQAVPTPNTVAPAGVDLSKPSAVTANPLAPGANIDAPSQPLPGGSDMFAEMKKQVDALVEIAAGGADPVAVGDEFYERVMTPLDDDNYGKLAQFIEGDGFLGSIGIYNANVKAHAEWFGRMRTRLVERIVASDTPP